MPLEKKAKQYGVLIVGLLIGGGFAFGGIASYSGLVSTGSNSNDGQQINTTLPGQNYADGGFSLSKREQQYIAYQNDVVFVNAFYETSSQKEQLENLEPLTSDFGDRVYVSVVNASESDLRYDFSITEYPKVVLIGGTQRSARGMIATDTSREAVSGQVCNAFRKLGEQSVNCVG